MLFYRDLNIQITGWATMYARFTFTTQANAITFINTGRYFNRQRFCFTHTTVTMTIGTWIRNRLTFTVTGRTGLLNRKKSLLNTDLSDTRARFTRDRFRAFFTTGSTASFTGNMAWNLNFNTFTRSCFFKCNLNVHLKIGTTLRP